MMITFFPVLLSFQLLIFMFYIGKALFHFDEMAVNKNKFRPFAFVIKSFDLYAHESSSIYVRVQLSSAAFKFVYGAGKLMAELSLFDLRGRQIFVENIA